MRTIHLRRFASAHQHRFVPLTIATGAGALSLFLTVRACRVLSPADSAITAIALGGLCEVAKLSFGPRAFFGFWNATRLQERIGYLALTALVLVLMAGSVGATFVFTIHTEAQAYAAAEVSHAQALAESDAYKALTKDVEAYDARIEDQLATIKKLRAINHHTQAKELARELANLQKEKDAKVAQRGALRGAVQPSAGVPSDIARWIHLVVAVVLELVGIAACVLVHICRPKAPHVPAVATENTAPPSAGDGTVVPIRAGHRHNACVSGGVRSVDTKLSERCAEARRMIVTGQLDPSQEALARSLRISQRPATRLLKAMCDEGAIRWAGNRYLLHFSAVRAAL